jgi:hypothetical protein
MSAAAAASSVTLTGAPSAPVADSAATSVPPVSAGAQQPTHTTSHSAVHDRFIGTNAIQQLYSDAVTRYIALHDQHNTATARLAQFLQACNRTPGRPSLPKSMQLRLVDRAHFEPVTGDAAFYADATTALRAIEDDATTRIAATVTAAKQKLIAHLASRVNQLAFISSEKDVYRALLQEHATGYEASAGAGAFPTDALLAHFEAHLHSSLTDAALTASMKMLEQRKQAAATAAADRDAQESVMQGAHNGKSIAAVAAKVVDQKLDPIHKLLQTLNSNATKHAVSSSTVPESTRSVSGRSHLQSSKRDKRGRSPSGDAKASTHKHSRRARLDSSRDSSTRHDHRRITEVSDSAAGASVRPPLVHPRPTDGRGQQHGGNERRRDQSDHFYKTTPSTKRARSPSAHPAGDSRDPAGPDDHQSNRTGGHRRPAHRGGHRAHPRRSSSSNVAHSTPSRSRDHATDAN